MKNSSRIIAILLVVLMAVSPVVGTSMLPSATVTVSAATSIKLNATSKTLNPKQTYTLKLSGTTKAVYWGSSNTKVATVSSKGVVTAKTAGTANIIAVSNGVAYTCKITVSTPKINKTTVSIVVGKTCTLSVSGTTLTKKWSSSNTSIATVDKNGKVTGKKAGTATITCKLSDGKKFTCKVTVKKSATFSKNNIAVTKYDMGNGVACVIKNNNTSNANVTVTVLYYNSNGDLIDQHSAENYCLQVGKTASMLISGPYDGNYDSIKYSSYKVVVNAEKASSSVHSDVGSISVSSTNSKTAEKVIVTAKNAGSNNIEFTHISVLFFDEDGKCIGYDERYAECEKPGNTDYINFEYPYDSDYNTIVPASYKVYVDYAYYYTF